MVSTDNIIVFDGSASVVDAGVGNDTYILSPYVLPPASAIQLADADNRGSLQLVSGLGITRSEAYANALRLTLDDGSVVTILDADKMTYEPGGNKVAGINNADISYASFVRDILGISGTLGDIPMIGGSLQIGNSSGGGNLAPTISGVTAVTGVAGQAVALPDVVFADSDSSTLTVTVTAINGTLGGLTDANPAVAGIQLTGTPEAVTDAFAAATVTGAAAGSGSVNLSVSDGTGTTPAGIAVSYAASTGNVINVPAGSSAPVNNLTTGADIISFRLMDAQATRVATQVTVQGFSPPDDSLQLALGSGPAGTTLAELNGDPLANGHAIGVNVNPFDGSTTVTFGQDANGGAISITLAGVTDPALVNVSLVPTDGTVPPAISGVTAVTGVAGQAVALPDVVFADSDSSSLTVTVTAINGTLGGLADDDVPAGNELRLTGSPAALTGAFQDATFTGLLEGAGSVKLSVSDGVNNLVTGVIGVTTGNQNTDLQAGVNDLFGGVSQLQVTSVSYTGSPLAARAFDASAALGNTAGLMLATGSAQVPTQNTQADFTTELDQPGDSTLNSLTSGIFGNGVDTFDAASLLIHFTVSDPAITRLSIPLIFASEEYPDFAMTGSDYTDLAGVFMNGSQVGLLSANATLTPQVGTLRDNADSTLPLEYNGISQVIHLTAPVHQGDNTLRLVIADLGDAIYDSALIVGQLTVPAAASLLG